MNIGAVEKVQAIVANFLAEGKFVCAEGYALILLGHERQPVLKSDSGGEDHGGQMMNEWR